MPPSASLRVSSYSRTLEMCFREDVATTAEKRRASFVARTLRGYLHASCFRLDLCPFGWVDSRECGRRLRLMITLTTRAARQVQSMHAAQGDAQKRLRVLIEDGGCSGFQYGMSFDLPKPGDQTFETEGVQVLVDPT